MKTIGLTGGIASGKSTVGRMLRALGVPVIDADQLARDVVQPGTPALLAIATRWPQVVGPDGALDRAKLGAIVFSDEGQRRELGAIVVPRIAEAFLSQAGSLAQTGMQRCVFEAATLFEEHLEHLVDGVLVVSLPAGEQVKRLVSRNGLSEAEARARLAAQWPLEEKAKRARWVIDNSGSEADLERVVRETWERICAQT
jgi:dephospho-CoA kinase